MADPYWSNVGLLCHFDGTNGSAAFVDASGRHTLSSPGASVLTTAQFQFGTASLSVAGSAVTSASGGVTDWQFGSGQFTVECWIRPTAAITGLEGILTSWGTGQQSWFLAVNSGTLQFYYSTTGTDNPNISGSYTPTQNAWVHIAADRDASNVLRVYANGAVITSATVAAAFFNGSTPLYIGNYGNLTTPFTGQIDEVRVTKGVARYAGPFTVPTAPFDNFSTPPGITGTLSATGALDTASFSGRVVPGPDTGILHSTEATDMTTMTGDVETLAAPAGVPNVPQGDVVAMNYTVTQDYPRLVFSAPRFEVVAIADIIQPSVLEAVEGMLPTLVPPYVNAAANAAVQSLAVQLVGSTMTGPLMLSPAIPTANTMAATKQYVDTMVATVVPEVPPVPAGQAWARQTGQWIPLAGGGTVTNIATGAGLTGGPITATGTIAMANMAANSLKGNNTGAVAAPTDIPAGNVLTMIGAAPLASPVFTGTPVLPTGTTGVTQSGGTSNTSLATTAFVAAAVGGALPLTGGTLAGPGNLTVRGGELIGGAGTVPAAGSLLLNQNTVAGPPATYGSAALRVVGSDGAQATVEFESYGAPNGVFIAGRAAGGTAASPTALGNNAIIFNTQGVGYTGSAFAGGPSIQFATVEPWTATANGTQTIFYAVTPGTTTQVQALNLRSAFALFSGAVSVPALSPVYLNGATTGNPGRIVGDGNNILVTPASSTGGFTVQNFAASGNLLACSSNGTLTATGPLVVNSGLVSAPGGGIAGNFQTPSGQNCYLSVTVNTVRNWYMGSTSDGRYAIIDQTASSAARLIIDTAGSCSASSTWTVISDAALKDQVEDHPHGLAEVLQLQPRRFRMIADDRVATGLIAQELEGVMPELVGEIIDADGNKIKTVTEAGVIWPLLNAIKEINARLVALEGRA